MLVVNASEEQLKRMFEICLDIIKGNVLMEQSDFHRLKKHKNTLTDLASRKVPTYKKRQIAHLKGGFLGSIAACALPVLAQLITSRLAIKQSGRYKK